jgi:hypothetical protein
VRRIFTSVAPTVMTLVVGFIVLFSYLVAPLIGFRMILIEIAIIVAGAALLLGFVRLMNLHWQRFQRQKNFYSLIALLTGLIVLAALVVERTVKPDLGASQFVLKAVLLPVQTSLGALLAIFLAAAALRMAQRRRGWGTLWFLLSAIVVLITQIPASPGAWEALQPVRDVFNALALGGLRGLLLGVALGTMAVAFRVLFAIDRPQSE